MKMLIWGYKASSVVDGTNIYWGLAFVWYLFSIGLRSLKGRTCRLSPNNSRILFMRLFLTKRLHIELESIIRKERDLQHVELPWLAEAVLPYFVICQIKTFGSFWLLANN